MSAGGPGEVIRLLAAARGGERDAVDRLVPLVYVELRELARRQLKRELRAGLSARRLSCTRRI